MYYYWIPIAILFLAAILSDTNTWSPFQSDQVKEICQNMTKLERQAAVKRSALFGALLGIVPAVTGLILGVLFFQYATAAVMGCILVFPLVALVIWKKWLPHVVESQQQFLASTEWAKSQGIKAEEIKIYSWQK
jgi:hypothetical protein